MCAKKSFEKWRVLNYKQLKVYRKKYYNLIKKDKSPEHYFRKMQRASKQRGIPFEVTFDFFVSLPKFCKYCGSDVLGAGVDRVDSSIGYIKENCVRCCQKCNKAKNDMSVAEFINHCKKIVSYSL